MNTPAPLRQWHVCSQMRKGENAVEHVRTRFDRGTEKNTGGNEWPGSRTQFATELGIISALRVKVEGVSNGSDGDGANGGSDDSRSLHCAGLEEGEKDAEMTKS